LTSFNWQGLDGTKVLAHFPPADTYNGQANVQEALKAVSNNSDRDRTSHSLHLIGNGDGGGGPQQAMLERIELMKNTLGLPQVKFSTPNAFFDALKKSSTDLETWQGELYLELHRGTYTTHAWVKSKNRHLERLLHEVELAAVLAYIKSKAVYPYAELERLWKLFLLQQFHDVCFLDNEIKINSFFFVCVRSSLERALASCMRMSEETMRTSRRKLSAYSIARSDRSFSQRPRRSPFSTVSRLSLAACCRTPFFSYTENNLLYLGFPTSRQPCCPNRRRPRSTGSRRATS